MKKYRYIIGIDEVGRGSIAGPVVVGAFVFLTKNASRYFRNVKESKQLSESNREEWFEKIERAKREGLIDFAVSFQSEKVIDKNGISYAIKKALVTSIEKLKLNPKNCQVLLDGGLKAPVEYKNQKTIIKGDEKEMIIALASICAKVLRDRKMWGLAKKYPAYGWEMNKGYGTRGHYRAIKEHGLTALHRMSFCKGILEKK